MCGCATGWRVKAMGSEVNRSGGAGESSGTIVLTHEGYAKLQDDVRRLETACRVAQERLEQALQVPGDLGDNAEYLDVRSELELLERRRAVLDQRLHAARVLNPDEVSRQVVSLGTRVVVDDLDDGTREEYVLVSSPESNPSAGRLSNESPVGRAIAGHHQGDVVDAHVPHGIRHLRIAQLGTERLAA
jgi:transcription elongation factor GreA